MYLAINLRFVIILKHYDVTAIKSFQLIISTESLAYVVHEVRIWPCIQKTSHSAEILESWAQYGARLKLLDQIHAIFFTRIDKIGSKAEFHRINESGWVIEMVSSKA